MYILSRKNIYNIYVCVCVVINFSFDFEIIKTKIILWHLVGLARVLTLPPLMVPPNSDPYYFHRPHHQWLSSGVWLFICMFVLCCVFMCVSVFLIGIRVFVCSCMSVVVFVSTKWGGGETIVESHSCVFELNEKQNDDDYCKLSKCELPLFSHQRYTDIKQNLFIFLFCFVLF